MAKTIEYRQCTLRKTDSESSYRVTVSFLPAKFARLHGTVKLKRPDGAWEDGWVVQYVGASITDVDLPRMHHALNKGHRHATGDSLPRSR